MGYKLKFDIDEYLDDIAPEMLRDEFSKYGYELVEKKNEDGNGENAMKTKTVKLVYFKESGKYYTDNYIDVPEGISWYEVKDLVKDKMLASLDMLMMDSDDNQLPYIVPHYFKNESN